MIFGNLSSFAIEFELDKEYGGVWLFGKFCYRIGGRRVGNYNLGTSLRDIFFMMETIIRHKANRTDKNLYDLPLNELYEKLDKALYGCESSRYDDTAYEEQWIRFDVTLPVDIFDDWKIFLIENMGKARVIVGKTNPNDNIYIYEVMLKSGEFDDVIGKTYEALNKLYNMEKAKSVNDHVG